MVRVKTLETEKAASASNEPSATMEALLGNEADTSLKYNVQDAVQKLNKLESMEEVLAFTKGDKRATVNRAVSAYQNLRQIK